MVTFFDKRVQDEVWATGPETIVGTGGSVHYAHKPLQRFWRDIHVGCEHPWLDLLGISHVVGRLKLGLPPDPTLIM